MCAALYFVYADVVLHTPRNGCDYDYDRAAHCTWTLPFLIARQMFGIFSFYVYIRPTRQWQDFFQCIVYNLNLTINQ